MHLAAFAFLRPIVTATRPPLSGVDWSVRLSKITAVGTLSRRTAKRSNARKSSAIVSKHPARSQRWVCCCTACHGGRSLGSIRHGQPARTNHRSPL